MFAYSLFQIVLCCVIAVGRFGVLTRSLMDACARSSGRLVTSAVISVCYVSLHCSSSPTSSNQDSV